MVDTFLMTVKQVARYLGLHPGNIYKKVREGAIPAVRIGRSWRFPRAMIDKWLTEKVEEPASNKYNSRQEVKIRAYHMGPVKALSKKIRKKIVDRINRHFKPEKIILFGSYAYGTPGKDSDVDLFIVMDSKERPSKRRIEISRLFRDRQMPMDFIVKTPSEVKERLSMGDFFINRILKKGQVLYEKKIG